MKPGPYEIYTIITDEYWYVGSASGKLPWASRRFNEHMGCGVRAAKCFRELVPLLGVDAFSQVVLEQGYGDHIAAEDAWYHLGVQMESRVCLNARSPSEWGGSFAGKSHTPESREKISKAQKGRVQDPEAIKRGAESNRGRKRSVESREKMRQAKLSKPGIPHTPKWNKAIGDSQKGKIISPETRQKISESMMGVSPSPGARAKISAKLTGVSTPQRQEGCGDCGLISTGSGIDRHARAKGHIGRQTSV